MTSGDKTVIASTSDAIIDYVCMRLQEAGAPNRVCRAYNGVELYDLIKRQQPGLLFIEDAFWLNASPNELMRLVSSYNAMRVYVFCFGEYSDSFKKRLVHAGIYGYLNIRKGLVSFREELKKALCGKMVVPPEFADSEPDALHEADENFTNLDMSIINCICGDMDNREIGNRLSLADSTVRNRRSSMYDKINVRGTVGLLKYLFQKGILDPKDFMAS